jgi:hypothetical protein
VVTHPLTSGLSVAEVDAHRPRNTSARTHRNLRRRRSKKSVAAGHNDRGVARDLHPGDIMQQHDWSLHVREVKIGPAVIAATVTEFGFELHYAAEEMLRVA